MGWPVANFYTHIGNVDYVLQARFVLENVLEVSPHEFVRTGSKQNIALGYCTGEFLFRKGIP